MADDAMLCSTLMLLTMTGRRGGCEKSARASLGSASSFHAFNSAHGQAR